MKERHRPWKQDTAVRKTDEPLVLRVLAGWKTKGSKEAGTDAEFTRRLPGRRPKGQDFF